MSCTGLAFLLAKRRSDASLEQPATIAGVEEGGQDSLKTESKDELCNIRHREAHFRMKQQLEQYERELLQQQEELQQARFSEHTLLLQLHLLQQQLPAHTAMCSEGGIDTHTQFFSPPTASSPASTSITLHSSPTGSYLSNTTSTPTSPACCSAAAGRNVSNICRSVSNTGNVSNALPLTSQAFSREAAAPCASSLAVRAGGAKSKVLQQQVQQLEVELQQLQGTLEARGVFGACVSVGWCAGAGVRAGVGACGCESGRGYGYGYGCEDVWVWARGPMGVCVRAL